MNEDRDRMKKIIVGITGATGTIYGIRVLELLRESKQAETHLLITETGEEIIEYETGYTAEDVKKLADQTYDIDDLGATIASGTFPVDAMVVVPCTVKTLSGITHSFNANLLIRTADVVLKERKQLVLCIRESPLHLGHISLMLDVTRMGAIIMPLNPVFYTKPKSVDDIVEQMAARILDVMGITTSRLRRWEGLQDRN